MKVFDNIKINLKNGELKEFRLFNIPICRFGNADNKKYFKLSVIPHKKFSGSKPIFYLKVNRNSFYLTLCLQHWINTIDKMHRDYVILCDDSKLEKRILQEITFPNENIKFIKSNRGLSIKKIVKNVAIKEWYKAAYAHLTTFLSAKNNNIQSYWNIDADDTLLCIPENELVKYLEDIEMRADTNNIDCISLDMYISRSKGKHWSFGISYIRMCRDWFNIFYSYKDNSWQKNYEGREGFNIDWFFTYLKKFTDIKIETFYIDNSYFIHWGNFLKDIVGSGLYYWHEGRLNFPIVWEILKLSKYGDYSIAQECIKLERKLNQNQNEEFIKELIQKYIREDIENKVSPAELLLKFVQLNNNVKIEL